jgi:hypothetical protein
MPANWSARSPGTVRSRYFVERAFENVLDWLGSGNLSVSRLGYRPDRSCVSTHAHLDIGTRRCKNRVTELLASLTPSAGV